MTKKRTNVLSDYVLKSIQFSEKERLDLTSYVNDNDLDLLDLLLYFVDNQVKVSMSYDDQAQSYLVSLTIKDKQLPLHKHVLMYRHVDPSKCLIMALFHYRFVTDAGQTLREVSSEFDW